MLPYTLWKVLDQAQFLKRFKNVQVDIYFNFLSKFLERGSKVHFKVNELIKKWTMKI